MASRRRFAALFRTRPNRAARSGLATRPVVALVATALLWGVGAAPAPFGPQAARAADPDNVTPNETASEGQAGSGGSAVSSGPGAIISNGTVLLGVNPEGHLIVPGAPASLGGATDLGLRFDPTNAEVLGPGCDCEGWGAADATSGVTGYANRATDGVVGLTLVEFTSTTLSARSIVEIGSTFRVTHDYLPSGNANLYEIVVTIENIGTTTTDTRYRRVMDWDVEPTAFSEHVTNVTGGNPVLLYDNNDGFATANPLGDPVSGTADPPIVTGDFTDQGPRDHGALFDFGLGPLAPGANTTFRMFYGAAATETAALTALASLGIETYSLAQTETFEGKTQGTPQTFIFGFANDGPPDDVPDEPPPAGRDKWWQNAESDDPVGTFAGDFRYSFADIAINGRGPAPTFVRSYNSAETRVGRIGPGWTHNYYTRLRQPGDASGDLLFVAANGNTDRYVRNPDDTFTPPTFSTRTLVRNANGTFTATELDQSSWTFDSAGNLTAITDRFGNTSTLGYNGQGELISVSDPAGRGSLTLGYTNGLLTSVADWASPARTVTYQYDADGRLWKVTDRENRTTTFAYDGTSQRLTTITDARGNVALTMTYDAQGRVLTQKDAQGLVAGAQTTFAYVVNGDGTRETTVTYPATSFEPSWTPTVTDTHNAQGWLTQRVSRPSSTETLTETFGYDADGNQTSITDARGFTTDLCYDVDYAGASIAGSRGNLTRRIDPGPTAGANRPVTLFAYDARNNPTQVVATKGVPSGTSVTCATDLSAINTTYASDMAYDATGAVLLSTTSRFSDPDLGPLNRPGFRGDSVDWMSRGLAGRA